MTNFEMVEKLREKANVTYEDAKRALEQCDWDILDAMVLLEREGKVRSGGIAYSTREDSTGQHTEQPPTGETFGEMCNRFFRWIGKIIGVGNRNSFVAARNGEDMVTIPITVLVLLLLVGFWILLPLMALGLFCGFRYRFSGPDLEKSAVRSVNDAMDKVGDMADQVKEEFKQKKDE